MRKTALWIVLCSAACSASGPQITPEDPRTSGGNAGSGGTSSGGIGGNGGSLTTGGTSTGGIASGGAPSGGRTSTGGTTQTGGMAPTTGGLPGESSGSRLKAKRYVGADGSKQFAGWYDSQLKTDCMFQAVNGKTVCLPAVMWTFYFADSACSAPLFSSSGLPGCPPSQEYGSSTVALGCAATATHIHKLQPIARPAMQYLKSSTGCVGSATSAAPAGTEHYYFSATSEVPLSAFVEAAIQTEP